jgi:hypothetical protein
MKMLSTTKSHNLSRSTTFVLCVFISKILKYHHTLTYDYGTYGFSWCKLLWNLANQIEGHHNDFKQKSYELQSCITFWDLQLLFWALLHPRSLTTTAHSLMTMEHMKSFGINSTKSCGVYLDIPTIKNKKLNYKVVDLVEYYNFDIKFVFIGHRMRKLWSFLQHITVGSSHKQALIGQCWF